MLSSGIPSNLPAETAKKVSNGASEGTKLLQTNEQTELTSDTPAATAATSSSPFGYTEAQANAILTNVREMRAALIAAGIVKDDTAN
jgi:hypothetical protein